MFMWIGGPIIPLQVEWFPTWEYGSFHDAVDEGVLTSGPPCKTVDVGETWIILSVDCVSGVLFPLSVLRQCMSKVLVFVRASKTSLRLIVVNF